MMVTAKEKWGGWILNADTACLEIYDHGNLLYQIPLDEIDTSASILDWIYQIAEKAWSTDAIIADLVRALVTIFGRGVCGGGFDSPVDSKKELKNRYDIGS